MLHACSSPANSSLLLSLPLLASMWSFPPLVSSGLVSSRLVLCSGAPVLPFSQLPREIKQTLIGQVTAGTENSLSLSLCTLFPVSWDGIWKQQQHVLCLDSMLVVHLLWLWFIRFIISFGIWIRLGFALDILHCTLSYILHYKEEKTKMAYIPFFAHFLLEDCGFYWVSHSGK